MNDTKRNEKKKTFTKCGGTRTMSATTIFTFSNDALQLVWSDFNLVAIILSSIDCVSTVDNRHFAKNKHTLFFFGKNFQSFIDIVCYLLVYKVIFFRIFSFINYEITKVSMFICIFITICIFINLFCRTVSQ